MTEIDKLVEECGEASERAMAAPHAGRNDLFDRGSYAARMQCADWCASLARSLSPKAEG